VDIFAQSYDKGKYFAVKYFLESATSLRDAAWAVAVGQSIGNPNVRSRIETDSMIDNHCCKIMADEECLSSRKAGEVVIAFPMANWNYRDDGVSQMLCHVMGGQLDIDAITKCHVLDISFPADFSWHKPRYGVAGIREYTGVFGRPILGGIVKPKTGLDPDAHLDVIKKLVDGGVNFIKEDEILGSPGVCPFDKRVPKIARYLDGKKVIFAACVNGDPSVVMERVRFASAEGLSAVHVNFWCGMGIYKDIRGMGLPVFLFFQKSGDKILSNKAHAYHVRWGVICKLAGMMGVDFIHAGMWGGYMSEDESELRVVMEQLRGMGVMSSLSCGMHPGLVGAVTRRFGPDYMANVGGAIHGHPDGIVAGAAAMRQAIDGMPGPEFTRAIEEWGLVE
jgi:ribulose-bisphosphate carboxylase large chain